MMMIIIIITIKSHFSQYPRFRLPASPLPALPPPRLRDVPPHMRTTPEHVSRWHRSSEATRLQAMQRMLGLFAKSFNIRKGLCLIDGTARSVGLRLAVSGAVLANATGPGPELAQQQYADTAAHRCNSGCFSNVEGQALQRELPREAKTSHADRGPDTFLVIRNAAPDCGAANVFLNRRSKLMSRVCSFGIHALHGVSVLVAVSLSYVWPVSMLGYDVWQL